MERPIKRTFAALLSFLLLAISAAQPVHAAQSTTPAYPSRPNVVWNVSTRKTVVVHIFNTTPFNLELASSDLKALWGDDGAFPQCQDSQVPPSLFTPSGIPYKIPAKSGASFAVSYLDTFGGGRSCNDDSIIPDVNLVYTMKQVDSSSAFLPAGCPNPVIGDVKIHLDFNRVKEVQPSLKGGIFKLVMQGASFIAKSIGLIIEPTPGGVTRWIKSGYKIAGDAVELANREGDTDETYFSAYVLPMNNSVSSNFPGIYNSTDTTQSTSAETAAPYDGLYSQHGTSQGCPQAYIIPAVVVQRETPPDKGQLNGHLPVIGVVLATSVDWTSAMHSMVQSTAQASAAGNKISQLMLREGENAHIAFIKLARTLSPAQHTLLDGAYASIHHKKPLTREQEAFLVLFAETLERHATALPRTVPVHKN